MTHFIKSSEIKSKDFLLLVSKLKEKTNLFDYITEPEYLADFLSDKFIVWKTDYLLVIGEPTEYSTGLKSITLTVVNHSDKQCPNLQETLSEIEEDVKEQGYTRVLLDGRVGWSRVFKDYSHSTTILYKDL